LAIISEFANKFKEFWKEFKKQKIGIVGLFLLILFITITCLAPLIAPIETLTRWNDRTYWEDLPEQVPPEWINMFSSEKYATQQWLRLSKWYERITEVGKAEYLYATYSYMYDKPPSELIFKMTIRCYKPEKPATVIIKVLRPDNLTITLVQIVLGKGTLPEGREFIDIKVRITSKDKMFRQNVLSFVYKIDPEGASSIATLELFDPMYAIFSKAQKGMLFERTAEPLKGPYQFLVSVFLSDSRDTIVDAQVVIVGRVYGLLGTDHMGRDLFAAIVWGTWAALAIGVLTSLISVFIGLIYGVVSAYAGGKVDEIMQRICEIMYSLPVLPLLILLAAIFKPSIWNIILILAIFSWPGISKVVRSMALQIKEMPFIEAAKVYGASRFRIVFKHILPQLLPYTFAMIALNVPGAILVEAGISFLGLGDTTIPTWGQILYYAQVHMATIKGMWWWVLPPGLAIALIGMSFAFIGSALDTILNPKLRKA